ncbi:MAG: hypothetical protein EBZ59_01910 [Planctomycetia bacterium]|nr:hypothetical protein [Planctomycetia bacterium]
MPIKFRCTRCRARLHVPTRWSGTSVACPKCDTRVVVPAGEVQSTRFERADVERSLQALEGGRGGTFSDASFEVPPPAADVPVASREDVLTVPRWSVYAVMAAAAAIAAAAFRLGVWWAAAGPRP